MILDEGDRREEFMTAEQVCELIPGLTTAGLAQMRFRGIGPAFFKPSPRKVVYARSVVLAWLASTEQRQTTRAS